MNRDSRNLLAQTTTLFYNDRTMRKVLNAAYTLVDLLVVIAIISILAALLLPAFARAKTDSFKSGAISNAKQIGIAHAMYLDDNDDRYVLYFAGFLPNDPSGRKYYPPLSYWPQTISPYIQDIHIEAGNRQALIQDLSHIFVDPVKGFGRQDPKQWDLGNISSWGLSDDVCQWRGPVGTAVSFCSINASQVSGPSTCLLLVETWDEYSPTHDLAGSAFASSYFDYGGTKFNGAQRFLDSPYEASYKKTSEAQEPDPKGRNITVFCDGHVKALATSTLTHDSTFWSTTGNGLWP